MSNPQIGFRALCKATFDRMFAAVALLVMLLPMALVAACIRLMMGPPVFFRDLRAGRQGRTFTLWKFRTMRNASDPHGRQFADQERLTWIGRLLRSTSFDELPQFWNVLRGDMSLVGPRPLLPQYLPLYSEVQRRRHDVLPGITGWVQVNGRNALDWEKKFELDVWYVDHWGLLLDLKIVLLTVKCVLLRSGISHEGEATMPFFTGQTNSPQSYAGLDKAASSTSAPPLRRGLPPESIP
ncbi:MAG: sugar transferase [Terracidiphilus sp.]|nr:sugar transferase [Terracidiphilus sp.]